MKPMTNQIEPDEISLNDGIYLVKKARESVEKTFTNDSIDISDANEKLRRPGAAFVTIHLVQKGMKELRGCIGYIRPIAPLIEVVIEVAREAAFNDPRFPPLTLREYPSTVFEVSILSSMKEMPTDPEERLALIQLGKTGLMAVKGYFSGLLLPQVPIEEGWDKKTFLEYTCLKAGLFKDCWKDKATKFYYFTAKVFEEEHPFGPVKEKEL